jgi:hypothetical protein
MLIVGGYVTNRGNDKQELKPVVDRADTDVYTPETVCADTGYYSEEAVEGDWGVSGAGSILRGRETEPSQRCKRP